MQDGEPWRGPVWQGHDAASNGVREGYRVIEEQIRRGRRMAQEIDDEPWSGGRYGRERRWRSRYEEEDWRHERRGRHNLLEMPMQHLESLVREILRQIVSARPNPWRLAELILRLQIEMFSELARLGFGVLGGFNTRWKDPFEEDVERVDRDIDETLDEVEEHVWNEEEGEDEPRAWSLAPSSPTTIRSTVPIPVHVSSHERAEIDVDLPPGAQSLELEIEPLLVSGIHPEVSTPAFEAEFIALADGPTILRIEVPRDLPAGRYRRRILIRATDKPVGDLTVQVGTLPVAEVTDPPKRRKRR